ncbi:MAG: InlB B-repeat-containing protein [Clostridia bacterium]|nr:InlB B-repeat-containing protein [Clostridia bacterium]
MKLTKRLVAVALAILMIFGSVSVAMTASAADGTTLGIATKILRNVNGVWTETSKVKAGEEVKLGVYLDTDFYAGDGEIFLYYDNTFFEPVSTGNNKTLTVGASYGAGSSYDIKGYYHIGSGSQAATYSQAMVTNGKIDSAYASTHDPLYIAFTFGATALTQKFDGTKLFCEVPFKVKAAPASTTGLVEAKEETACSPEFRRGRINVSKGGEGVIPSNADNMWNWKATLDFNAEPVSLYTNFASVTFDANSGKFEVASSKYATSLYSEGEAGEKLENLIGKDASGKAYVVETFAEPTRDGYNFVGWKVSGADDSTATKINLYPAEDTTYVAVWEKEDLSAADNLTFRTEIHRLDENGEWVKTDKVMPGETVKARLFIDTEYNAGNGEIIMFYDGDFFEDSYDYDAVEDLVLNQNGAPGAYGLTGHMYKPSYLNTTIADLIDCGYIDVKYLNDHPALVAAYEFPVGAECQVISGDEWFLEFELKVKDSEKLADTTGDFYILDKTVANTTDGMWAFVSIPKEAENSSYAMDADSMFLWDADVTIESNPVSIYNTIRFDANGGEFDAENTETYTIDGTVGAKVDYSTIPEVTKEGYTFFGWIDASDDTPTLEEAKTAEQLAADEKTATMTHNSIIEGSDPAAAIIYNAFWVSNVNITFAVINPETGAVEEIKTSNVASGDPLEAPEVPALDGYRFIGWTDEYKDGKIGATKPLPETYPSVSTTYYAVYSAHQYTVNYYVIDADDEPVMDNFKLVAQAKTEYGAVIAATPHTYTVPEGYVLSAAYDEVLYGEEVMFIEAGKFVAGTTMPASEYNLYFKIERAEFDAIFNANGGAWADGETTKTVKAVFDEEIVAPEAPVYEGYVFAGWEPDVTIMDEEGKNFNATWTPETFTATYHIDSESYPYHVEFGDEMESPADPYKVGYNFLGWAEEEGSTAVVVLPATMPAKNVDYYAVFEAIEYTITFANTGDTEMDAITLPYGTEIGEIAEPTKTGYTFAGWNWTKAADSSAVDAPATMPAYDTVATAEWTINQYTVTWIVDGNETVKTYDYLAPVDKAEDPVKTGYTFEGWAPEFPADGLAMPAEDLTYTAVFTANTYDAVFNTVADGETHDGAFADGATSLAVPTVFGEEIVAPAEEPVRTGYTFAGWDPIVGSMDEEGKTYTAVWTPNANTEYTVEFWSMLTTGEYELTDTQYFTGESDSVIKLVVSAPKNYTINKDESTYDNDVTIAPDGSTVVTVYFDLPLFTITFVGNEGTVDGEPEVSSELRYGAQVSVPATEREGYTFKGWFDAAEGGNALDVNLTAIEPVTYYAQWEINQYTITFDTVGGTEIPAKTQDYGTAVEAPADPEKLGHTFAGWDVAVPTTMPAEDMTITAQWTVNSYDAIFNAGEGAFADGSATATTEDVVFGEEITAPAENPSREGYDFIGWSTDGETVLTPVGIMDAEGKKFKAVWEINQYTITFADTGDTVIAPITQDYATAVTAPADPEKEGYTFTGWDAAVPAIMPAEDITITAQWTVNQYDATFDAGEDAVFESTGETAVTNPVDYNSDITTPDEEPTKTGYTFAGWKDEDGNIIPAGSDAGKMDADGETFTAEWTPNTDTEYKVVVNYTDAQTGAQAVEYLYYGTTDNAIVIVEATPDPAAENTEYVVMSDLAVKGYVLDEEAENQLTGVVAADGSTVLNLYYKATKVTATFDAGEGAYYDATTSKTVEIDYNSLAAPVAPAGYDAPTREGYTFGGWQGLNDSTRLQADRTFTAIWNANQYTLTWDLNGADVDGGEFVQTDDYKALVNKQTYEVREGYTFAGWVDENGAEVTVPDTIPAKDLTIIATYDVNSYDIVWNDGTKTTTETKEYGSAIVEPAYEPAKEGYTFNGWATADGKTPADVATVPVDGVEFAAQWTKNSYTVNYFVKNPTTGEFDAVATATVAYGDPISTALVGISVEDGYSLVEIAYTDTGLTAPLAAGATMPANNVNLYYDVIANEYNAVFNANGGAWADGDTSKTVVTAYKEAIEAPVAPSLEGNEFAGWAPAVGTMDEFGKTFVAQWTPKTYKATYKANGGVWGEGEAIETTQVFDVVYGAAVTAPTADPTRVGYTFKGWDKAAPAAMPAEDLVFTAKWEINKHTITFKDGDKTVGTLTGDYGTAVTAPADPTKEGYTFTGWDANVPATMPDEDVTINATWEINKYDVIWNVDGVTTIVKDVPYGETIKKATDPEKTGYTFKGWNGYEAGMTMPAKDVEFVAVFEAKEYTVTFDANDGAWDNGDKTKTVTAKYGDPLEAPVAPSRTGYTFQTWSPSVPTTMPAENATYKAIWATAGKVDYAVETYYMNTVGTYEDVTPVVTGGTATIDAYVKLAVDEAPEGFKFDTAAANYIEGVVAGDGSTVFKVYYARNTYTIKFVGNEGTINGNPEQSATYYYGTAVVAPAAVRTGYDFIGWSTTADGEVVAVEATALADATYYAQWDEAIYTATFKALPGAFEDGETTVTVEYAYGEEIAKAATPVREGYDFVEWAGYTDGMTIGAEDVAFTAVWAPKSYNAVFYTDNTMTETHETKTANYTENYNVATDPTKTGYTFDGWYDAATNKPAGLPAAGEIVTMPLGGAEYYATWTVNKVNLVYRANGGTFEDGTANKTYPVDFGTPKADMPAPAEPTREGYSFNGYTPALPETMPATQLNLVAQWTPNEYDVTFDAGEGVFTQGTEDTSDDVPTFTDKVIYEEQPVYVPDEVPVRDGYEFGGWEDEDGNVYNPGDEIPMTAGDVKLDAIWTAKEDTAYTVNHIYMDVNGTYDDAEIITQYLTAETDSTVTAVQMDKDNFTFDAAASTVEGIVTADGALVLNLYYVREKNTFTTYDEDGNVVSAEEVYFDAPLSVEDPTKEGYTFAGWTDAEGNPITVPATMPGDKLDIYESWTLNSYNVTFDANTGAWADGETVKTVATKYGEAIVAPAEKPVKAGYNFLGWFDAKENGYSVDTYTSMPELADGETITFYARWEAKKNEYTIHIFEMQPNGEWPEEPTSMVINNALVGETVAANIKVPAGFTLNTTKSVLEGVVPETGELVLEVYLERAPHTFTAIVDGVALVDGVEYYYDETVKAIETPVKDGYTFAGWTATAPGGIIEDGAVADASYPARMPNNSVTIYGVWSTNSYNAIFNAGDGKFESTGLPTETVPVTFGGTITAPAEVPVQEGFEFGGWKAEDGTVYQPGEEIADAMTSAGATFEAVWNKSIFTVTFYGYEELTESPYKSENATKVLDAKTYDYDVAIEFPAAPTNIDAQYYTFLGWSKTEGGAVMSDAELYNQKMPAEDTAYYAVYERVKVMLIPNSDANYWVANDKTCTTVIDRTGDNWYVYGLTEKMLTETPVEKKSLTTYVDVQGDGYYEVVDFKAKEDQVGTGTVINVYDNVTGELVETFTIIIFGDINGDGGITNTDYTLAFAENDGSTSWSASYSDEYCHYKAMAVNISGDNVFSANDATLINYYVLGKVDIDQAAGCVTDPPSAVG